ncbi:MAG: MogA/MoaB family molybdenum cofactor biosynthesis protein [Chloroflexi bacterium]|nr:MogA/MoaB family molybdenum cofactor biosynthesis protein [Chloroflexota bacterium]
MFTVGVLTISDRVSRGEAEDRSGPLLARLAREVLGWDVVVQQVVPDEREQIREVLRSWADDLDVALVLTTGGTGFAPRDVTPEATRDVIERETPGLVEAMRSASLQVTPHAMLSRAVAGIRGRTLIVNMPGSPKAVEEQFHVIAPALPHGIRLLRDVPQEHTRHE